MKFQNPLLLGFAMLLLSACATADPPSTVPFCGDGTRQAELGEACDDGNRNNGDGCSADCRVESAKQEWFCDNAQDDDGDGMIDCADPDCGNDLNCQGAKESNCSDGLDDDNDGNADCLDEDCDGRSCGLYGQACNAQQCQCPSGFSTESQCGDNQDNDCDGKVDCFDEDCLGQPACDDVESNCSNGEDDDDDGFIDCADSDCEAQSCGEHGRLCEGGVCACPGASFETNCDDDSDDDCDGDIDCDDSDCVGSPDCIGVESVCDDGLDNDGDSMSDCMDPDCASKSCGPHGLICSSSACVCPGGATESACGDGIDNDCDAAIDCEDSDCASFPACRESVCNDSIDNDGDGDADCLDSDCNGQSCGPNGRTCASNTCSCPGGSVENACMDGADNDCDGNADCADSDCSNTPACNPVSCEFDTVLLCGYQIEASTIGESNGVSSYSCHSHNSSGGEFIINYLASTNSTVELSLTDMSADLDLMVMPLLSTPQPDCSPNDCDDYSAATGSTQESITFNATAGRLYAFAVDGKNGASSDFTFTIVCSGGTGCAVADYVSCGDTDAWNNYSAGSTNNIDTYDSSCTGTSMTGPEYTYLFYADVDGTLDVEVSGLDSDLDVFIMPFNGGVCDNSISCIGKNTAAGTSNFTASATIEADNLYYVVFDGWGGAESDYNVSFNCR